MPLTSNMSGFQIPRHSQSDEIKRYFEQKSELRPLPMKLDDSKFSIDYKNGVLCINDDPLEIVLFQREGCDNPTIPEYEPFHKPERVKSVRMDRDEYLLMPKHDHDGLIAFIAVRYAWGVNTSLCYLDTKHKKVYMLPSDNYDHPDVIAIRRSPDGLDIHLFQFYDDEYDDDLIEEDKTNVVHVGGQDKGMCSGWWNWEDTQDDFKRLQTSIKTDTERHNKTDLL
jgi:hypothetical protein